MPAALAGAEPRHRSPHAIGVDTTAVRIGFINPQGCLLAECLESAVARMQFLFHSLAPRRAASEHNLANQEPASRQEDAPNESRQAEPQFRPPLPRESCQRTLLFP